MLKRKVLIVEDEEVARNFLKRAIDREGYETILATDGREGLNLFQSIKPDIVITDLKMPETSGMEVLHTIKEISPATEVILVTGHGEYDTVVTALREGALDYLKKPIDLDELILSLGRARERIAEREKISIKTRLLILEDDKNTRDKLAATFEKEGYKVLTGADGEEGIKLFSEHKIDILLVDIRMPRKDGLEVLREVRKVSRDCEIIMITGFGDEDTAIQAMREGAINYIRKPIDLERLLMAVQKAEDKLQLQRAYLYKVRELELAQEIIAKVTEKKQVVLELPDRVRAIEFGLNLINAFPVSLVLTDENMNVDFVNSHFTKSYGFTPERIEERFIQKSGLEGIGFDAMEDSILRVFSAEGSEIVTVPFGERNQMVMTKLTVQTHQEKKDRVLIMIGQIFPSSRSSNA